MYPNNPSRFRPRSPQQATPVAFPAPAAGINAISNIMEMSPQDAIFVYNLISGQYGLRTRDGYQEWCTNVGTGGVRTIIPYVGSDESENKLFACAEDGIYDVTSSSSTPTQAIAFASTNATSGYGVWYITTNTAGAKFLCYCDETNGYYVYTESSGTWAKIAMGAGGNEVSGVNPANFCFVMSWKNRLWFIERGTGSAWYLAVGALFGAATKFEFGNKFKYGGSLEALYNWTVDGGIGVDDYLVGISGGGDVIVYQGTDPSTASTIDQRGNYFIGPPPVGRRIGGNFGGELFLLSSYGLIPITKLLSGQSVMQQQTLVSARITPIVNSEMALSRTSRGWEVKFIPSQNIMMISSPKRTGQPYIQYVQSTDTNGWSFYRALPHDCGDTWQGLFYFGDADNRVMVHTGSQDDVPLGASSGIDIEWALLTAFHDLNSPSANKVVQFIRPTFLSTEIPSYFVQARYDYDIGEIQGLLPSVAPSGSEWDVGAWDSAIWGGDFFTTNKLNGGAGMGRSVAMAARGQATARTTLVRFDVAFTVGNIL